MKRFRVDMHTIFVFSSIVFIRFKICVKKVAYITKKYWGGGCIQTLVVRQLKKTPFIECLPYLVLFFVVGFRAL